MQERFDEPMASDHSHCELSPFFCKSKRPHAALRRFEESLALEHALELAH
jgi:hypothetical protein